MFEVLYIIMLPDIAVMRDIYFKTILLSLIKT